MKKELEKFLKILFPILEFKIGEGWDYRVFPVKNDNTRVIKVLHSLFWQLWHRKSSLKRVLNICTKNGSRKSQMLSSIKKLRPLLTEHGHLLGNPRFIGTTYIQDRVLKLNIFMETIGDKEERTQVLSDLWELNEKFYSLGFYNRDNKLSNYGITEYGQVILMDLSDITFDAQQIEKYRNRVRRQQLNLQLK
ncbi:MAG: hypothetical protein M3Q34_00525 [bacterium]|nr:hypothetical protein [bacterium]